MLSGNSCVLNCGLNEVANDAVGKCDCAAGYFRGTDGKCAPRCKIQFE